MKELIRVRVQYASKQQCCKTHKLPLSEKQVSEVWERKKKCVFGNQESTGGKLLSILAFKGFIYAFSLVFPLYLKLRVCLLIIFFPCSLFSLSCSVTASYLAFHCSTERDLFLEIPVTSRSCEGIKYILASKMASYGSFQCLYNLELLSMSSFELGHF